MAQPNAKSIICGKLKALLDRWNLTRNDGDDVDSLKNLGDEHSITVLRVDAMSGGKINYILKTFAQEYAEISFILKTGPAYAKVTGPEVILGTRRRKVEYEFLQFLSLSGKDFAPKPYFFHWETNTLCMEELKQFRTIADDIIKGCINISTVEKIAICLATLHKETHISSISDEEFTKLDTQFENDFSISLLSEFCYVKPYNADEKTNFVAEEVKPVLNYIHGNTNILKQVDKFRRLYLEKKECLLHGDFHAGAILLNDQEDIKMIDFEFAHIGPCAVDVMCFLAPLIAAYQHHRLKSHTSACNKMVANKVVEACKTFVDTYLVHMTCFVGERKDYMRELVSEITGFTGCELIWRTIGVAHFAGVEENPLAEKASLEVGIRLLEAHHQICSTDMLVKEMLKTTMPY